MSDLSGTFVRSALVVFVFLLGNSGFAQEASSLAFPLDQWETTDPASLGWDKLKLEQALAYALEQETSSIVVAQSGKIIAERHTSASGVFYRALLAGKTKQGHAIEDVASLQKSIVALLAVRAADSGLLSINQPVSAYLGAGWSKAKPALEQKIHVEHLLSMTSGLDTDLEFVQPAGTVWLYNTNAYSVLIPLLEKVTNKNITELTSQWLAQPLGMHQSGWAERAWVLPGMDANKIGYRSTARDMARLGVFMLAAGKWGEQALLNEQSIRKVISSSQDLNPAYGWLWWINGERALRAGQWQEDGLIPTAPDDLVAAFGALGRKLYVVPSLNLVVARLGNSPDEDFDRVLWHKLMAAAPE